MKDKIFYKVTRLSKKPFVKTGLKLYYRLAIKCVQRKLGRLEWVESAHLKGSYLNDTFEFGISDLDFFIIGAVSDDRKEHLKKWFDKYHLLFPMLKDFDFHTSEDAKFLFRFGGAKFFFQPRWIPIKGSSVELNYYFHPLKFYLDVINEVYFQFEYLIHNLNLEKSRSLYRTLTVERQYNKVLDLMNRLVAFDSRKPWVHHNFLLGLKWKKLSNEEIIKKFNKTIANHGFNRWFLNWLKENIPSNYLEDSLLTDFFKNKISLYQDDFKYNQEKLYLTQETLELFYYTGCIDSSVIWKYTQEINDAKINDVLKLKYYSHLLEGYPNYLHDIKFYHLNKKDVSKIIEDVDSAGHFITPFVPFGKHIIYTYGGVKTSLDDMKETGVEIIHIEDDLYDSTQPLLHNLKPINTITGIISKNLIRRIKFWGLGASRISFIHSDYIESVDFEILKATQLSKIFVNNLKEVVGFDVANSELNDLILYLFRYSPIVPFAVMDENIEFLKNKYGLNLTPLFKDKDISISVEELLLKSKISQNYLGRYYPYFLSLELIERKPSPIIDSINYAVKNSKSNKELHYALFDIFQKNEVEKATDFVQKIHNGYYIVGNDLILEQPDREVMIRPSSSKLEICKFLELDKDTYYNVEIKFVGAISEVDTLKFTIQDFLSAEVLKNEIYTGEVLYYISFELFSRVSSKKAFLLELFINNLADMGIESFKCRPYKIEKFYHKIHTMTVDQIKFYRGVYKFVVFYEGDEKVNIKLYSDDSSHVFTRITTPKEHVFYLEVSNDQNYTVSVDKEVGYIDILKLELTS